MCYVNFFEGLFSIYQLDAFIMPKATVYLGMTSICFSYIENCFIDMSAALADVCSELTFICGVV